jgi:hypothetical protein
MAARASAKKKNSAPRVRAGERARDEARKGGGPRMHGRDWHDHDKPKPLQPERVAGLDAATDVESGGDKTGMGRRSVAARAKQSNEKRKRFTPAGKGIRTKASGGKSMSRMGAKSRGRGGNPG